MPLEPLSVRANRTSPPVPEISGLSVQPLRHDDVGDLTSLVSSIESHDGVEKRTGLAKIREELSYPWNDLAVDTVGVRDQDGALVAWALVDRLPGSDQRSVRVVLHGGVHPAWRQRGIGCSVLQWQAARAHERLAQSEARVVGRIICDVAEAEPPGHARLLVREGFAPVRYFTVLRRDLREPIPEVELGADIRIVPYTDDLDDATRIAHNDSFRDHWGSEEQSPEAWAQGRDGFSPEWSFLAVTGAGPDQRVVGYELATRSEVEWPVAGYTFGYTELLGVVRDYRGRGLAVALLARAMEEFRAAGMEYAALDVDSENPSGAYALYERLGYSKQHTETLYAIEV